MPGICAILLTHCDAQHIGRALETLRSCDYVIVVDSGSTDGTVQIARQYGARVMPMPALSFGDSLANFIPPLGDWVLSLSADEAVSESLEAELYEWRIAEPEPARYVVPIRRQDPDGEWHTHPGEPRLIHRKCMTVYTGCRLVTPKDVRLATLQGAILQFSFPPPSENFSHRKRR